MGVASYAACTSCGKMFLKVGTRSVCPECAEREEGDFLKVKEYLYEYPNSTIEEVSEQTEVSREVILGWIKDGRIEAKGMAISYPCSICGKPIHMGKICMKCQKEMGAAADSLKGSDEPQKSQDSTYGFKYYKKK